MDERTTATRTLVIKYGYLACLLYSCFLDFDSLGDQVVRWTNDIFMFFGADYEVNIEPIYTCVTAERPMISRHHCWSLYEAAIESHISRVQYSCYLLLVLEHFGCGACDVTSYLVRNNAGKYFYLLPLRPASTTIMSLTELASVIDGAFQDIPVIDISCAMNSVENEKKALAYQIRDACMNVGFFYVKNHGIPPKYIDNILEVNKEYFMLPTEEKLKLNHDSVTNFRGYIPLLDSNIEPGNKGDLHEGFQIGWEELEAKAHDGAMAGANVWPERPKEYREAMLKYYHAAVTLGKILFPLFALSLDLPERYFDDKTKNSAAIMNVLYYPPQTGPADDRIVGIGAHTDFECFTILWQQPEIQALQVLNSQKQWIQAPPIDGTLLINLGDQFARWTNDIFKSTVHRAVNRTGVDRYSIPLFFGTDYDVNIEPVASCVSAERPARYGPVLAGEHVSQRLKEMYF